jgi:glycerol-3-phosphate cytidylyltransferase
VLRLYTGGTFDIPHIGHVIYFEQCKRFFPDSYLVVSLNTDDFIERFKKRPPIFSYNERMSFISRISYVDKVIPNIGGEDSKITILQENPDVIVIGNDWLEKDYCKQMSFDANWLTEHKIALCYIPRIGGMSTTMIKERLRNDK